MIHEIKRIGVVSVAKMVAFIMFVNAAIFGLPVLLIDLVAATGYGVGAYVIGLIVAPIGGGISGAITTLVYNFLSGVVGGIEVDLSG